MKADLSPSSVGARLPFADAVAQRLAELRALCALTEHLHARDRK